MKRGKAGLGSWVLGLGISQTHHLRPKTTLGLVVVAALLGPTPLPAQETHVVIVSGIPGSPEHAERFREWSRKMIAGVERLGVAPEQIVYLSDEPAGDTPYAVGPATRAGIEKTLGDLAAKSAPDDVVLVVLIGHGSAQNGEARFNLSGPDMTAKELGRLLDKFPSQRVGVVNAASASGEFVAALSKKNRTIVTATRSGSEKNETVFAQYFVAAYAGDGADADKDGRITLLEAFEYARKEVTRFYESEHRIQTEHALIDDNGDREGSREPNPAAGDGAVARRFVIGASAAGRAAQTGDSTLAPLYAEARKIEEEIATLRGRKESLKADEYENRLEDLLVKLAEKNAEIRSKEKAP
jgi:hypothetical protein